MKAIRLLVVGCNGKIAEIYRQALEKLSGTIDCKVVAGIDVSISTGKWGHRIRHYTDFASFNKASLGIDAILILTPLDTHGVLLKQALAYHVPTLIEKPMMPTAQEANEIFSLYKQAGVPLFAAYHAAYSPAILYMVNEIQKQCIREINIVYEQDFRDFRKPEDWNDYRPGAMLDSLINALSTLSVNGIIKPLGCTNPDVLVRSSYLDIRSSQYETGVDASVIVRLPTLEPKKGIRGRIVHLNIHQKWTSPKNNRIISIETGLGPHIADIHNGTFSSPNTNGFVDATPKGSDIPIQVWEYVNMLREFFSGPCSYPSVKASILPLTIIEAIKAKFFEKSTSRVA